MEKTQHNIVDPEASLKHHCRHRPVHRPPSPSLSEISYASFFQRIRSLQTKNSGSYDEKSFATSSKYGRSCKRSWQLLLRRVANQQFLYSTLVPLIELLLSSDFLVTPFVFDSKTKQAREVKHMESKLVAVLDMLRRHSFCGKAWCARTIFKTLEKNSIWSMDA